VGVSGRRLPATSAVRDASNRADRDRAVRRWTGEPMEVLAGEDEARISFLGATHGLTDDPRGAEATPPWLVLDIGGGSTEAILGSSPDAPEQALSTNVGSVRLTERFMPNDPPSAEDLDALH